MRKKLVPVFLFLTALSLACNFMTNLAPPDAATGEAPLPPSQEVNGFSAEATDEGSVLLKWEPISGAEQYLIEVQIGGEFMPLATLPADQTSYEDGNVPPATRFTYRLSSLVSSKRGNSKEITVETPQVVSNPLQVSIEFDQSPALLSIDPNNFDPSSIDPNNFDPSQYMAQPIQTEAMIGPQGGEISVTGSNSVIYTLNVPPKALRFEVPIKLKPISSIPGLPLSGGLMAAVFVEPHSLVFDVPATLKMTLPADFPAAAGPLVLAFAFEGNGQEFHLYPFDAAPEQSSVRAHLASLQAVPNYGKLPGDIKPVKNGGGYGQGSGTAEDVKAIGKNQSSKSQNRMEQALAVSQLDDLEPLPNLKVQTAVTKIGEAIREKASHVDDMSKLMDVLDDFNTYLSVGGDKYHKELTGKIFDQLVNLAQAMLKQYKRECLTENMLENDFKAEELIRQLTHPEDSFWKTFAERFKKKYGQQLLDELAKERECSYELSMNSKLTISAEGSTHTATSTVPKIELMLMYAKGEIYFIGGGDMKLKLGWAGLCSFPLQQYDSLGFLVNKLVPIFEDGVLTDFTLIDYSVIGWKKAVGISAKPGDDCPVMVSLSGGGDYWTGLFMGARSVHNPAINDWKLHPLESNGVKAIWQSPTGSFAAPGTQAIMTEDTKFELKISQAGPK